MRKLTENAWRIIGIGLILIWLVWFWNADQFVLPERAGRSALPFYIHSHLKLARSWEPFNRGSLRLICTTVQKIHIVLQAELPGREHLSVGAEGQAILHVKARATHELSFHRVGLVAIGPVDTLLTESLSAAQLTNVADWMDEARLKGFQFTTLELGVGMGGLVRGKDVREFASRCTER